MKYKYIIRDVAIIWGLTSIGGFVIGAAVGSSGLQSDRAMLAISLSNMLFSIIGFCISGSLAKVNRFSHLYYVAVGVWLLGITNVFLVGVSITQWLLSAVMILLLMLAGGWLSFIFSQKPSSISTDENA